MKLRNAKNSGLIACTLAVVLLTSITSVRAVPLVTLTDGNSQAWVDVNSPAGMNQWIVDGVNHLNQQWFWFRSGNVLPAPINAIGPAVWYQSAVNKLNTTYANAAYSVQIDYTLTGGGLGTADIGEGIKIHNFTANPLSFTFYQYSDFNLLNTPGGDSVQMDASLAYQSKGATQIAEGIIAPNASAFEANVTGLATSTLSKLGSTPGLILNNNGSAAGDVTWAFQWDLLIAPFSDEIITKDKLINMSVVPEPGALPLIGLGVAAFVFRRRQA
jgi:hypothetical protein